MTNLQNTLFNLNGIKENVEFTMQKETNSTISFLDIAIIEDRNKFKFDIYIKPTPSQNTAHILGHTHEENIDQ